MGYKPTKGVDGPISSGYSSSTTGA